MFNISYLKGGGGGGVKIVVPLTHDFMSTYILNVPPFFTFDRELFKETINTLRNLL